MKLILAIIFIVFYVNFGAVYGIRTKRGLRPDEQKMFLIHLNNDRQEVGRRTKVHFRTLKYDADLERDIETTTDSCRNMAGYPLSDGPKVAPLAYRISGGAKIEDVHSMDPRHAFFNPKFSRIGCSKTYKCTRVFDGKMVKKEHIGKKFEVYGACEFSEGGESEPSEDVKNKIDGSEIARYGVPMTEKYAALLGIEKPSAVLEWKDEGNNSTSSELSSGASSSSAGLFFAPFLMLF